MAAAMSLKQGLLNGHLAYGAFLCSASPVIAELLGHVGYDVVVVDTEHGPGGTLSTLGLLQALAAAKTPGIVRVPENNAYILKKTLDLGPSGVMVPMVDSREAAERAVAACRYAPRGLRGCAPSVARASAYGTNLGGYLSRCEQDLLLMVQIESESAVGNIRDIAAVEGIDCLFIGPMDLSASIGHVQDPSHPEVQSLVKRAEEAVLSSGKILGGFAAPFMKPAEMFDRGYRVVCGRADINMLRDAAKADIERSLERQPAASGTHAVT